jgi:hypothetical protein
MRDSSAALPRPENVVGVVDPSLGDAQQTGSRASAVSDLVESRNDESRG